MKRRDQHGGAVMMMVVAVLIVTAATFFSSAMLNKLGKRSAQNTVTVNNIEAVRKSLINFVTQYGYLPCPANGAANTGLSVPTVVTQNCTNPDGTVPWASLGISEATALDGWSRKISYRVYQGATGLTQANGANMTDCDVAPPTLAIPTFPNRLCDALTHQVSGHFGEIVGFLSPVYRPGFSVTDLGVVYPQAVGMVLISHGESGEGAWTSSGSRLPLPGNNVAAEYANTQTGPQFFRAARTDSTVLPTANTHFDDEVAYMSIADIINQARRGPRKWAAVNPLTTVAPVVNFNGATINPALTAVGGSFNGRSSGVSTLTLQSTGVPGASILISTAPGSVIARITPNNNSTAIGVCQAPPATCNGNQPRMTPPEYLSFLLTQNTAEQVSFQFQNFTNTDQAQFVFKKSGVVVGTPVTVTASTVGQPFTVKPQPEGDLPLHPLIFDEVVVTAVKANPGFSIQSIQFSPYLMMSTAVGGIVDVVAAGNAVGVCTIAAGTCDDASTPLMSPEYLSFKLTKNVAGQVSFIFQNFASPEQVQFTFRNVGIQVGTTVTRTAPTLPVGISPSIVGALFDEVIVTPVGASTSFLVQSIKFCNAPPATCPIP